MTTRTGDGHEGPDAPAPAPSGMSRRRLLAAGLGTAVGGAAALVTRPGPAGARPAVPVLGGRWTGGGHPTGPGRRDAVADWLEQIVAVTVPPHAVGVAERLWAMSWMSARAALQAGAGHARSSHHRARFADAAVATAVHDVAVALVPDRAADLDAALATSLAAVPDGEAKRAGIRAGRDAAARMGRDRQGDGLDPASLNPPFTPPPEAPGVFRLPPGAPATQGAGIGLARPFVLDRPDRFRPGAPPALGTELYRGDLHELQRLGGAVAPERTELQSDIAWLAPQRQYLPALQALVREPGRSLAWKVHLLAAYAAATIDAQIATGDAKFAHLHWRPVTAIRAADTDGDPLTRPDPAWSSYLPTPANPEYPSAHGSGAGAAEQVLTHFTGPRTPVAFTADWTRGDGRVVTREYGRGTRWSVLTQENVDARVWAGVHFRFSDEVGATLGRQVAAHALERLERR